MKEFEIKLSDGESVFFDEIKLKTLINTIFVSRDKVYDLDRSVRNLQGSEISFFQRAKYDFLLSDVKVCKELIDIMYDIVLSHTSSKRK
jgi:hypothetical protein